MRELTCVSVFVVLIAVVLAAGVWAAPILSTIPVFDDWTFSANLTEKNLKIYNGGDGLLSWSITTSVNWLSVDQSSGTNEAGYLNLTNVRVIVNRTGLADDTYLGELYVTSNGGSKTYYVTMIVQNAPYLTVNPTLITVSLSHTSRTLRLGNGGAQMLTWSVSDDQPWIEASPPTGTISGFSVFDLSVDLDPLSLPSQTEEHSAVITVSSDGGNADVPVLFLPSSRTGGILGLYSDVRGTNCNLIYQGPGLLAVNVVHTQTDGAVAIQFSAPKPDCWTNALFLSDTDPYPITVGSSQTGKALGYGTCLWPTIHATTINYFVQDPPGEPCCVYPVLPDPNVASGEIEMVDCDKVLRFALGGYAIINPNTSCMCEGTPIRVEDTTWGRVKAMYAE